MANRNEKNEKRYKAYMDEIHRYKDKKVTHGPTFKKADPNQPALSEDAEILRQANQIDKANAYDELMRRKH